ncbi:MAG: group III truncated hemoglobin [Pseudomonadota bacterium]
MDRFYDRVLADPLLAPVFLDVARVKLAEHLPRIKAYWCKMLLGDDSYRRHMMAKHRAIDARRPFSTEHYARWLLLFEQSLAAHYHGPGTERAKTLARRIAGNMRRNLEVTRPKN